VLIDGLFIGVAKELVRDELIDSIIMLRRRAALARSNCKLRNERDHLQISHRVHGQEPKNFGFTTAATACEFIGDKAKRATAVLKHLISPAPQVSMVTSQFISVSCLIPAVDDHDIALSITAPLMQNSHQSAMSARRFSSASPCW
jgi:hypothetical protein